MTTKASYAIKSYCHIRNGQLFKNGELLYGFEPMVFSTFSKEAYKALEIQYPKFFKMDDLSKLAFLGAELILGDSVTSSEEKNIALVFSNHASSLVIDRKHQETISDGSGFFPSPANFVYTLPNICLGEISIRHKLYSENSFFIFDAFNPSYLSVYATSLLSTEKADEVLCGWVNVDQDEYEAFLYLVSEDGELPHNLETLNKLYKDFGNT